MSLFNTVLQKIQKNINSQNEYKKGIIESVKECCNITITVDNIISLKDGVLVFQVSPTIKTVLLLKKDSLIKKLQERNIIVSCIK